MNKTVERIVEILDYVANSEQSPTMSNISQDLDIPKSSAFDLIHSLLEKEILALKDPKQMTLGLGIKAFEIGHRYLRQIEFWDIVHAGLEQLVTEIERSLFFIVSEKNDMVVLDFLPYDRNIYPNLGIGFRKAIFDSEAGRVYLACLSDEKVLKMLPDGFSEERLMADIRRIRSNGFYIREVNDSISISAPIFNYSGQCSGVIAVYDLKARLTGPAMDAVAGHMKNAALSISQKMGYTGKELFL